MITGFSGREDYRRNAAAQAVGIFRGKRDVDMRQMGRKHTPAGATPVGTLACRPAKSLCPGPTDA